MVLGNDSRCLITCECSSWGSHMREAIFASARWRVGALEGMRRCSIVNWNRERELLLLCGRFIDYQANE